MKYISMTIILLSLFTLLPLRSAVAIDHRMVGYGDVVAYDAPSMTLSVYRDGNAIGVIDLKRFINFDLTDIDHYIDDGRGGSYLVGHIRCGIAVIIYFKNYEMRMVSGPGIGPQLKTYELLDPTSDGAIYMMHRTNDDDGVLYIKDGEIKNRIDGLNGFYHMHNPTPDGFVYVQARTIDNLLLHIFKDGFLRNTLDLTDQLSPTEIRGIVQDGMLFLYTDRGGSIKILVIESGEVLRTLSVDKETLGDRPMDFDEILVHPHIRGAFYGLLSDDENAIFRVLDFENWQLTQVIDLVDFLPMPCTNLGSGSIALGGQVCITAKQNDCQILYRLNGDELLRPIELGDYDILVAETTQDQKLYLLGRGSREKAFIALGEGGSILDQLDLPMDAIISIIGINPNGIAYLTEQTIDSYEHISAKLICCKNGKWVKDFLISEGLAESAIMVRGNPLSKKLKGFLDLTSEFDGNRFLILADIFKHIKSIGPLDAIDLYQFMNHLISAHLHDKEFMGALNIVMEDILNDFTNPLRPYFAGIYAELFSSNHKILKEKERFAPVNVETEKSDPHYDQMVARTILVARYLDMALSADYKPWGNVIDEHFLAIAKALVRIGLIDSCEELTSERIEKLMTIYICDDQDETA